MKNRIFSLVLSLAVLFFFAGNPSFAQNKPEKKNTKTEKHIEQTKMQNEVSKTENKNQQIQTKQVKNQKDVKSAENKMSYNKNMSGTMKSNNKTKESVNTEYHKKQVTTNNEQKKQEKPPMKGEDTKKTK